MKGYKVFNSDWTCRDFQYKVGETYEIDDYPILCKRGFHFCTNPVDCFKYYNILGDVRVAEIEALGVILQDISDTSWNISGDIGEGGKSVKNSKCCTNKIKIVRELSLENAKIETTIRKIPSAVYLLFRPYAPFRSVDISKIMDDKYITFEAIKSIKFSEEE